MRICFAISVMAALACSNPALKSQGTQSHIQALRLVRSSLQPKLILSTVPDAGDIQELEVDSEGLTIRHRLSQFVGSRTETRRLTWQMVKSASFTTDPPIINRHNDRLIGIDLAIKPDRANPKGNGATIIVDGGIQSKTKLGEDLVSAIKTLSS